MNPDTINAVLADGNVSDALYDAALAARDLWTVEDKYEATHLPYDLSTTPDYAVAVDHEQNAHRALVAAILEVAARVMAPEVVTLCRDGYCAASQQ